MHKYLIMLFVTFVFSYSLKAQCNERRYDVYTPVGNPVATWLTCEDSYSARLGFDVEFTNAYPNAQKITTYEGLSSTAKFNCHGYAWLRVEQGIDRWIGFATNTEEDIYMSDGSYTQVSQETYPGKVS